jgi:hypothetical protein
VFLDFRLLFSEFQIRLDPPLIKYPTHPPRDHPSRYTFPYPDVDFPAKHARMHFGGKTLEGALMLIPEPVWIVDIFFRFFSLGFDQPLYKECLEPLVLLHPDEGKSWINAWDMNDMSYELRRALTYLREHNHFIALTDKPDVFGISDRYLAECDYKGEDFKMSFLMEPHRNNLIFALPTDIPLGFEESIVDPKHLFAPAPISPDLQNLIRTLQYELEHNAEATTKEGTFSRKWLKKSAHGLIDHEKKATVLVADHLLQAHRGNLNVFGINTWRGLCYPSETKAKDKKVVPYHQDLFLDPQLSGLRTATGGPVENEEGVLRLGEE